MSRDQPDGGLAAVRQKHPDGDLAAVIQEHPDAGVALPARIVVAGASGAGKSTAARRIAARLSLPYTEIDGLFHGPDWQPRPEFLADVERLIAGERWITEWQYGAARDRLAARAELMVWLDYPRALVMRRVIRRTLGRRLRATRLWNGNREPPLRTIFSDPDHIIRWAWRTQPRLAAMIADGAKSHPGLAILRLRTPSEFDRWLETLG